MKASVCCTPVASVSRSLPHRVTRAIVLHVPTHVAPRIPGMGRSAAAWPLRARRRRSRRHRARTMGACQLKARVWRALDREITEAGLPYEAAPDGMTVEIDDDTDYEPDALVNCGPPIPGDAIAAPNSVVIVEVLSPGTASVDRGRSLRIISGLLQCNIICWCARRGERSCITAGSPTAF